MATDSRTKATWVDQGLFFSLILNAAGVVGISIACYCLHKLRRFARFLRPNRPGSKMSSYFTMPREYWQDKSEHRLAKRHGVEQALHQIFFKYCSFLFIGCTLVALIMMIINVTDAYNRDNSTDPFECNPQVDKAKCIDGERANVCEWQPDPEAELANREKQGKCIRLFVRGLFDLSADNQTPGWRNWRTWLFGISALAYAIVAAIAIVFMSRAMSIRIRESMIMPPNPHARFGALAACGGRTVIVSGLDADESFMRSPAAFYREFLCTGSDGNEAAAKVKEAAGKAGGVLEKVAVKIMPFTGREDGVFDESMGRSNTTAEGYVPHRERFSAGLDGVGSKVNEMSLAELGADVIPESINIVPVQPDGMIKRMKQEAGHVTELTRCYAEEQYLEEDQKPYMHRKKLPCCCKKYPGVETHEDKLEELREEHLRPMTREFDMDKKAGYVFFTFDRPSKAWMYVEKFSKVTARSEIVGPRENIFWHNVAANKHVLILRWVVMILLFIVMVLVWAIPLAFFGSLASLSTIPGIGDGISAFTNAVGPEVTGIIEAMLPAIIIAIFNGVLLPLILKVMAHFGGVWNVAQETTTVFILYWIMTFISAVVIQAVFQGSLSKIVELFRDGTGQDWLDLLTAIFAPPGGVWLAYVLMAGLLLTAFKLLVVPGIILYILLGRREKFQQGHDLAHAPRRPEISLLLARHCFVFAICALFHCTLPVLIIAGAFYYTYGYVVWRAIMLDEFQPMRYPIVRFNLWVYVIHVIALCFNMGTGGAVLYCALKKSWGGLPFAALAMLISIAAHVIAAYIIRRSANPSAKVVCAMDRHLVRLEDVHDLQRPYMPDYSAYLVDEDLVPRLRDDNYVVDWAPTKGWVDLPKSTEIGGNDPKLPPEAHPNGYAVRRPERKDASPRQAPGSGSSSNEPVGDMPTTGHSARGSPGSGGSGGSDEKPRGSRRGSERGRSGRSGRSGSKPGSKPGSRRNSGNIQRADGRDAAVPKNSWSPTASLSVAEQSSSARAPSRSPPVGAPAALGGQDGQGSRRGSLRAPARSPATHR